MRQRNLAFLLLGLAPWVALSGQETSPAEALQQLSTAASRAPARPASRPAGDGHPIPIQREWVTEQDPASFKDVPFEQQPFRYDQRTPQPIHTEKRPGHEPVYYFKDVRWRQEEKPKGATIGRRAYFTTVRADPEKIKAAYFCMKPFAPKFVAGHSAIFLEFEPGGFTNMDGESSPGCVISYEAYLRVTQKYGMIGGQFSKKYRILYVVSSWRDFLMRSITLNGSFVKRWKLALSRQELLNLTKAVGRTIMEDHSKERYNTTRNSCVTAALELIDEAVPPHRRSTPAWLWGLIQNPGWALPVLADNALKAKGLIDGRKIDITEVPPE